MLKNFKVIKNLFKSPRLLPDPVNWKFIVKKANTNNYYIHMMAFIESPWRLYAQASSEDDPFPTIIRFEGNPFVSFIGRPREIGNVKETYEETYSTITHFYTIAVDFVQEVEILTKSELVKGKVTYMECNGIIGNNLKEIVFQVELN
ncbi:hypothetical protein V8G69_15365 [Gaetbulibacter sp. M235]|uniref:hypothetical protein n=1 Tax=Gaetbulibacter sp. M235 TaxID=3126510 RepID=UPI00374E34CF